MRCKLGSSAGPILALAAAGLAAAPSFGDTLGAGAVKPALPVPRIERAPEAELLFVEASVNGVERGTVLLLRDASGRCYVDAETLERWGVAPPYPEAVRHNERSFHALDGLAGVTTAIESQSMTATVTIPPELLEDATVSLSRRRNGTADATFGAYLDYDLAVTNDSALTERTVSSLLTPTLFTRRGNLSADFLYDSGSDSGLLATVRDSWVRLETTWTRDDPGRMRTLRIGDTVTPYGSWARSVRLGGVQLATNFATQPTQVTFPQPSITGTAAVPSALDIFVNGSLRSRVDVPGGAFRIDDIPVVTGTGQVQVVARDLLGREQVITQDFYASERLLRAGLNEYSISAGALRRDYGLVSNDYGDFFVAGLLRRGLSDVLTIEGRLEGTAEAKAASASLARAAGRRGVTSIALAVSTANATGALWQVGHEYRGRLYRANLRVQRSDRDFVQPGLDGYLAFPKRQIVASGGRMLGRKGSLGLSLIDESFHGDEADRQILTASYSRLLRRSLSLSASASRIRGEDSEFQASVVLSRALGPRTSASASLQSRGDATALRFNHRYEAPAGPGFGYRTSVQSGDEETRDAEFLVNTTFARYSAELRRHEDGRGWRLQTRGSIAALGGDVFATREIRDGFAVVDVGGFDGVRVYLENREIGTTNASGLLLVPGLRPYEPNQLRVESRDLPLTARVANPSLQIAPYYRSGTVASFGVDSSASAIMRVVNEDGAPIREGARARVGNGPFEFPVGLDGRLYVQLPAGGARVEVDDGALCAFELPSVPAAQTIPFLGDRACLPAGAPVEPVE